MKVFFGRIVRAIIGSFALMFLFIVALLPKGKKETLIWGPVPILNNKYWSEAMQQAGFHSMTYMTGFYSINSRNDFDKYLISEGRLGRFLSRMHISNYIAFVYCLRHAAVIHIPFSGSFLGGTLLEPLEATLLHLADCKIIVMPYGGDFQCYSKILDKSVTVGLLASYPQAARREEQTAKRVKYWTKNADCMLCGLQVDGIGRWDVNVFQFGVIDTKAIAHKQAYSKANGKGGSVKIIHTPNHRGVKGTEFLIEAVHELKEEGLKIELVLVEKKSNHEVLQLLREADILAEQFILGYALSAIEGMAVGLPVLSNLDNEDYTRVFRRYSYLNECPILSTTPETLKDNLRLLVTHPELREVLGKAGRKYVEKYHSYKAAQYLFGNIYDKILYGKDVDLMNLFHPLKSEYVKQNPIQHPLVENKLPKDYFRNNS